MMTAGAPLCNTCGEPVGLNSNGQVFVACHECNYAICKPCFDADINDGRTVCLRCAAPYDGMFFLKTKIVTTHNACGLTYILF